MDFLAGLIEHNNAEIPVLGRAFLAGAKRKVPAVLDRL
jgi:hypothetical protein